MYDSKRLSSNSKETRQSSIATSQPIKAHRLTNGRFLMLLMSLVIFSTINNPTIASRLSDRCVRVQEQKLFRSRIPVAINIEAHLKRLDKRVTKYEIMAVLVNAWHESKWNPASINSSETHFGLFQWSGHMHAATKRLLTTQGAVTVLVTCPRWTSFTKWCRSRKTITWSESAKAFARIVERPQARYIPPRGTAATRWARASGF